MRFLTATVITGNTFSKNGNYYETVYALTPKEQTGATQALPDHQNSLPVGPLVAFAPIIIFFALFIGAFGIQVLQKAMSVKRTISALVIALLVASTPYILGSVRDGVGYRPKAGPEEVPRQVNELVAGSNLTVTWFTDAETLGAVRIGTLPLKEDSARVVIADGGRKTREHRVVITNLPPGGYEFEIYSVSRWYDNRGEPLKVVIP